ncbi:hypothetical protein [Haladaptatus sp.]|uniref:hypothetical protein n=1 Tax=Haladaptatus sp. TaxID=1973141 RepID=UPI003C664A33
MGNHDDIGQRPATRSLPRRRLGTMGRRRFVTTLAGAGFGSMAALLTPGDVRAAGRDEVPLVYGRGSDSEPLTTTVPADWFADLRAAFDAHERHDLLSRHGIVGSAVVPGEFGGRNAALAVDVTDDEATGSVPERIGDVAVEVNHVEAADTTEKSRTYDASFDDDRVPGSVECGSKHAAATLCPAMYDDGAPFFATSNHLYGDDDEQHRGEPFYVKGRTGWRKVGKVGRGYALDDFVRIDPVNDALPTSAIHGVSPSAVMGQFTRVGLAHLKARRSKLQKVAAVSGYSSGRIQAVDGMTCAYGTVCKHGQLKWGSRSSFTDGDSGSVSFHPDLQRPDDGVLVASLNNARTWWPVEDYIWGTAAYRITADHGVTFSPPTAGSR